MKRWRTSLMTTLFLAMLTAVLSGCGGYANEPKARSGVEAYGVIDVGVTSRR